MQQHPAVFFISYIELELTEQFCLVNHELLLPAHIEAVAALL
jgi:hypothetical protein